MAGKRSWPTSTPAALLGSLAHRMNDQFAAVVQKEHDRFQQVDRPVVSGGSGKGPARTVAPSLHPSACKTRDRIDTKPPSGNTDGAILSNIRRGEEPPMDSVFCLSR